MLHRLHEVRNRTGNYLGNVPRLVEDLFSWDIHGRRVGLFRDRPIYDDRPTLGISKGEKYRGKAYTFKDEEDLQKFYAFLRRKGLYPYDVPQQEIIRRFGRKNDPVGYRIGNDIYVASDFEGKPLPPIDRMVIAGHEYRAGYNHMNSDRNAQLGSIETFTSEYPHKAARRRAIEMAKNLGINVN